MKIENLISTQERDKARVAATVRWEDCERPAHEVYFETDAEFAESLSCNPHAFLIACIIPATYYGEKRVFIDAEICPELRQGLIMAMSCLRHWYYRSNHGHVRIEAKTKTTELKPRTPERAGIFFSGGIDSFAALRANRLNFPLQHPGAIKDGLLVYGLELDAPEAFHHVIQALSGVAEEVGLTLIPVSTNLYLHYRPEDAANQFRFWGYEFQGAALSAVAHAFARRLTSVSIAASSDFPSLGPWGSHPLLDPNYSSADVRIRHEDLASSRFAKTQLVAEWKIPLQHLRVCNQYRRYSGAFVNCGQCEKCVRTMLALLALGALERTCAFPLQDVSAELVLKVSVIHDDYVESCYQQLIPPLMEMRRHDLVQAIKRRISIYRRGGSNWKEKLISLDKTYCKSSLVRFKNFLRSQ